MPDCDNFQVISTVNTTVPIMLFLKLFIVNSVMMNYGGPMIKLMVYKKLESSQVCRLLPGVNNAIASTATTEQRLRFYNDVFYVFY